MDTLNPEKRFATGDTIMHQGDEGSCAYFIEEGQVEIIMKRPDGEVQHMGTRGPGTIIGEMAIVDNQPRVATIKALQNCKLLEVSRDDFIRRLKNSDPVMQVISQVILTRYRDTLRRAEILMENPDFLAVEEEERAYVEQTNAVETIKMANELKIAIENDQLFLNYQPILDLGTGQILGFEALMRWQHPKKGLISPGVFIPVAEESGLIVQASRWALRESCKALKRIEGHIGYDQDLFMSVNFSSTDFAEENFLEQLYLILSETDVEPRKVHLEITERLLMSQPENAKQTLNLCRQAGLGVSIDDFGTGYSSLSYLHHYPIDTLKIDQTFIRNMHQDKSARNLVNSIISLGKSLQMRTIAEGIEEKEEAQELRELGCDMAQGYYFAKPLSETNVTDLVKDWDPDKALA